MRTSEGVGKKYAHTMISTATKPQSIFPPRSLIAPILTRNDSHQRLDLYRRCLRGIEFLSRTQRLVSRSSSTGARAKREPLTSTATSPGTFKADWTRACRSTCIITDLQPGYARAERHLHHPDVGPVQGRNPLGLRFLRRSRLARTVEGDRLANERLEGGLVNFFSFVDVDRAACVSVETRVEETGRILQRRTL